MEEHYEEEKIGTCQTIQQHEDAALKTSMQFFAEELLPYLKIPGKVGLKRFRSYEALTSYRYKVEAGENLTKRDLVPLTLCPLMGGEMPQKERIRAAYHFTRQASLVQAEDIRKIEAVIYAMADKFLESMELEEIVEDISMTRLGQMLVDKGMRTGLEQGLEQGIERGMEQGMAQGIRALIQTCQELGVSRKDTEARILQNFEIDEDTVQDYLQKYWK